MRNEKVNLIPGKTATKLILLLAIPILFFCFKLIIYHWSLIACPLPLEYREGTSLLTTYLLTKGINPYALLNQPQCVNPFGIFYSVVVYPFALLAGSGFMVHRAVTAFFIIMSCGVIFSVLKKEKTPHLLSVSATLVLYCSLLFGTTPISRPDGLGIFLFLSCIFLPYFLGYSRRTLVWCVLLGILGFYTKQYCVLGVAYLASYMFLFVSKKKAILFSLAFLSVFVLAAVVVNQLLECYFNNTLFGQMNIATNYHKYRNFQFIEYIKYNFGILTAILVSIAIRYVKRKRRINTIRPKKKFSLSTNFIDINKPLFSKPLDYVLYCFICSLFLLYVKFAGHMGQLLTYFFQLLSPFLVILLSRESRKTGGKWYVLTVILLLATLWTGTFKYMPEMNPNYLRYSEQNWNTIDKLISVHKNVLHSPALVSLLTARGRNIYRSGNSVVFRFGMQREKAMSHIFPVNEKMEKRYEKYIKETHLAIAGKKFDLIILARREDSPLLSMIFVRRFYQKRITIPVVFPHSAQIYRFDVWTPKE